VKDDEHVAEIATTSISEDVGVETGNNGDAEDCSEFDAFVELNSPLGSPTKMEHGEGGEGCPFPPQLAAAAEENNDHGDSDDDDDDGDGGMGFLGEDLLLYVALGLDQV
jgi:hypothetical protein